MVLEMKFEDTDIDKRIEDITNYAEFMKKEETKKFLDKWNAKGYKKAGVTELLLKLWLLSDAKKSSKSLLREAAEILGKLKGEEEWFSFLSDLKLTPEKRVKEV